MNAAGLDERELDGDARAERRHDELCGFRGRAFRFRLKESP